MTFSLQATDLQSSARAGLLHTDHGDIETPIFMPVGTQGTVKSVGQKQLKEDVNAQIILGNTYHLYLRPGTQVLSAAGGLHKFIAWDRPILTDSGGFQVFSLSDMRKIREEGTEFRSHLDGSKHIFTPENVVDIQRAIGSDIMMAFDECMPYPCDYAYAKRSVALTHRWLKRGLKHFAETEPYHGYSQAFFPIVQGSVFRDLRLQSAEFVAECGCEGNAIGGLAVGEPAEEMYRTIELVNTVLPADRPRYLMGVGTPANILESIALGVDMFDCVMPTRNGRNGGIFTWNGIINIRNEKWKNDFSPLEAGGASYVDEMYSKAYLRHLIYSKEILGAQIASQHNLAFFLRLVREARRQILQGTFAEWKPRMVNQLSQRI